MTDNDQAAVDALLKIRRPTTLANMPGDFAVPYTEGARAVLAAIRNGEIKGVVYVG